jgi:hypothetical protein
LQAGEKSGIGDKLLCAARREQEWRSDLVVFDTLDLAAKPLAGGRWPHWVPCGFQEGAAMGLGGKLDRLGWHGRERFICGVQMLRPVPYVSRREFAGVILVDMAAFQRNGAWVVLLQMSASGQEQPFHH